MSASSEYEQAARQDYGPTTSTENVYENESDHKLVETMSIPSIRTPVLRAVPISSHGELEPDSTNPESLATTSNIDKEVEYHIAEKPCNVEMSMDTLAGIVRIEEATIDNVGRITYPLVEEEEAMLPTLVQGVAKLPQNFTINMEGGTMSVAPEAQLWLPTLLATGDKDATSNQPVQQIIISEGYGPDPPRRGSLIEANYIARSKASKVQILSNISLPNNTVYSTQFQKGKEVGTPLYAAPNHVYKLSASVVSQKHFNSSVLSAKPSKSQTLGGTAAGPGNGPVKGTYSHTYSKGSVKAQNKVNNGANLGSSAGTAQCHILSRVVSGPNKLSVHTGRKSVNTFKGSKNGGPLGGNQKQSRAIKIIQQTGSAHKTESKGWGTANYRSQPAQTEAVTYKAAPRAGSPTPKSLNLQKMASKGERLFLQSPCGPVLLSAPPRQPAPPLRYVHAYSGDPPPTSVPVVSQVSANQQLTAQILQSLAQPKMMLHSGPVPAPPPPLPAPVMQIDHHINFKPNYNNQRRIVFGDPSMLLTADDIIGMEERPNLSDELRRYSFQALAFIMLDHTYSQPVQKQLTAPAPPKTPPAPPVIVSPPRAPSPPALTPPPPQIPSPVTNPPPPPEDDAASIASSADGENRHSAGSDTETAPEGEDEGRTRCICDFTHDDGYMICCDRCGEWQHVDCMGIDRGNIPDAYMCAPCDPREVDRRHARAIQLRKREELRAAAAGDAPRRRLLTVTTYCDSTGAGSHLTTYNTLPVAEITQPPAPPIAPAVPVAAPAKRPVKRLKKPETVRKAKRKLTEKRVKRKKEMLLTRNKYTSSVVNQSHWQDSYESAVTNHYSPELRAKMMKYSAKLGSGGAAHLAAAATAHLCTTVPHAGGKILIATRDLPPAAVVTELRGKYMLSTQHRPQPGAPRLGSQKPGPFVFFYRLPRDGIQVCIDTRTYGNEARFVRRSCRPNAELQHCIVKGALHVYLVTTGAVPSNTEITVGHDAASGKQPCACGNAKHCRAPGAGGLPAQRRGLDLPPREKRARNRTVSTSSPISPLPTPHTPNKEIQPPPFFKFEKESPIKRDFEPMSPVKNLLSALNFDKPFKNEFYEPKKEEELKDEPMEPFDLLAREEMKPDLDEPDSAPIVAEKMEEYSEPIALPVVEQKIETREPVIIEPAAPVVEPKIEEEVVKKEEIKELFSDEDKPEVPKTELVAEKVDAKEPVPVIQQVVDTKEDEVEKIVREVAAKSACHDRSARTSRTACVNPDSLDDKTDDSQEKLPTNNTKEKEKKKMTREERKMEAIMKAFERMEKAQQRKQEVKERQKRRESDPHPHAAEKDDEDDHGCTKKRRKRKGRARTTSQSNRRRLNSADSDMLTSGDEGPCVTSPRQPCMTSPRQPNMTSPRRPSVTSPRRPSVTSPRQPSVTSPRQPSVTSPRPSCITSPRRPPSRRDSGTMVHETRNDGVNEDIGLSSACLLVEAAVGSVESAFKLPKTKKTMANEWLGRSPERTPSPYQSPYRPSLAPATSLESLVRVASTMIGDLIGGQSEHEDQSPPRTPGKDRSKLPKKFRRVTRSTQPEPEPEPTGCTPQHSAKKRWLRQAISEESEEVAPESPPSEMVTPLKKRRLARESVCYERTVVPCNEETSPQLTSEDSPIKSWSTGPVPDSCLYGRARDRSRSDSGPGSDDQTVLELDSDHIRRVIGAPPPRGPPPVVRLEDIRNINNNHPSEDEPHKPVPMEIDLTILPTPQIKDSEIAKTDSADRADSPPDKVNNSADTSGNSSPHPDDMDDIQKKIHSFHTENIQILKSRNKKPPKEKRKKVNLNFDLNMVDDQISIQLRTEDESKSPEMNGDVHEEISGPVHFVTENIPLPATTPVETIPLPDPETIPLPAEPPNPVIPPPEAIPLPEDTTKPTIPAIARIASPPLVEEKTEPVSEKPSILEGSTLPFSARFSTTGLFSGIFSNITQSYTAESQINENVPNLQIIKSAIDRSASLDGQIETSPADELRSVREILSRVNSMDSNNSVLLSDVLRAGEEASAVCGEAKAGGEVKAVGSPPTRRADPRLHPPPVDKPKPVRRKLSISEYRKRLKTPLSSEGEGAGQWSPGGGGGGGGGGALSPRAEPALAADELEARLHKVLGAPQKPLECVFDAQPTASERQREKLSSRLRREFGLALPDDDSATSASASASSSASASAPQDECGAGEAGRGER